MRLLILVDGLHTEEMLQSLSVLLRLSEAELLLVFVRSAGPRAGLGLVRHRPGHRALPPARERDLAQAELQGAEAALQEAERLARPLAKSVSAHRLDADEAGRAVCDLAARQNVDLVIVRARGRDQPPGPRSLGPTARFISDHCRCPVLLLRT